MHLYLYFPYLLSEANSYDTIYIEMTYHWYLPKSIIESYRQDEISFIHSGSLTQNK